MKLTVKDSTIIAEDATGVRLAEITDGCLMFTEYGINELTPIQVDILRDTAFQFKYTLKDLQDEKV